MEKINGIIVLDKPQGKTSHDMVYFMRRLTGIRKIGHTGTLDPQATGVLPICIGNATKAADMLTHSDKGYIAEFKLGITSDTEDIWGNILSESEPVKNEDEIRNAVLSFIGDISQIPPMYSAIKQNGKKLYELAREGRVVERKARTVTIHGIDILEISDTVKIRVDCSKGTYIRTLCADIGKKLGCGAVMTALRRIRTANFVTEDAYSCEELTELAECGELQRAVKSTDEIFEEYPPLYLTENQTRSVKNGVIMTYRRADGMYRVYDNNGAFICVGEITDEKIRVKKSFWT